MEKTNILLVILALGLVLTSAILAFNTKSDTVIRDFSVQSMREAVTVSAEGKVVVVPDEAEVYVRVTTEGETAIEAQDKNKEASNSVLKALKAKGVDEKDMETTQYYVSNKYSYDRLTGESEVTGYQVFHVIKVTTKDIEEVGALTDTAVSAGANGVDAIQFTLSEEKEKEVRREALGEAANSARQKAEAIASSLGISLGRLVSVSESTVRYTPYMYDRAVALEAAFVAKDETEIMPQNLEVTTTVTLAYAIE